VTGLTATRDGWVDGLIRAAEADPRVMVLDADVARSIGTGRFAARFPDRHLNLGISEQDMVSFAAGLALAGFVPFVESYAVFVSGRAWEQIRTSVCHMGLDVKIGGAHAGLSAGPDGATHQALEDIAIMRVLPGMTVLVPADARQAEACAVAAAATQGPVYVRFGRNPVPVIYGEAPEVRPGGGDVLEEGRDALLIGSGVMVNACLEARALLAADGISASVLNAYSVKPLPEELILGLARRASCVVVACDCQQAGGVYGAVAELLSAKCPVRTRAVCVGDMFGTSGTPEELLDHYGLNARRIFAAARDLLR
jgi:transketolase